MTILYVIMIAVGLAMAIYAVAAQKGASIVELDVRLIESSLIAGAMQFAAAIAGYGIGVWILSRELTHESNLFWVHVAAGFLLAVIGIRMLMTAFQKHTILEHRMEKIDMKADTISFLHLTLNALVSGIACGLMEVNLIVMLAAIFVASNLFVIAGYLTGRAYGGESGSKAYAIGGGLLCIVGVCLQVVG